MSQQTIVGIGYKKGRGKDTFANFMVNWLRKEHPELQVRKVGFADKLKDISHQLYKWAGLQPGIHYESNYPDKEVILPAIGMTPRQIWIKVGNALRDVYSDTWIDFVLRGGITADVILVKDMGFTNEATKIQACGGTLVRMDRDGEMATDGRETELDSWEEWHFKVSNKGDLRALNDQVIWIGEQIFGGPRK
jgi:hypothetical protein